MATVPDVESKSNNERTPLLRERVRRALAEAGPAGKTAHELALKFYGESNPVTRRRIFALINTLRHDGAAVVRIKDREFLIGRYVLTEGQP